MLSWEHFGCLPESSSVRADLKDHEGTDEYIGNLACYLALRSGLRPAPQALLVAATVLAGCVVLLCGMSTSQDGLPQRRLCATAFFSSWEAGTSNWQGLGLSPRRLLAFASAGIVARTGSVAGGIAHLLHSEIITESSSACPFVLAGASLSLLSFDRSFFFFSLSLSLSLFLFFSVALSLSLSLSLSFLSLSLSLCLRRVDMGNLPSSSLGMPDAVYTAESTWQRSKDCTC